MKYNRHCTICGDTFIANTAWARYCSLKCKTKKYRDSKGYKLADGRFCKQCGVKFYPSFKTGANQQHCTEDCSARSARNSRSKFWKNQENPEKKRKSYYDRTKKKLGADGNLKRFSRRHPEVELKCQAVGCGETRVLDLAHKPEFKRNGAWRSVKNTTPEKIWILCPTCHALLDRKGYSPESLGLVKGGGV